MFNIKNVKEEKDYCIKKRRAYCNLEFHLRSEKEHDSFLPITVYFQHYLRKELKKKRSFDVEKLMSKVIKIMKKDNPKMLKIPKVIKRVT